MPVREIIFAANSLEFEKQFHFLAFAAWLKKKGIEFILVDAENSCSKEQVFLLPDIIRREKIQGNYIARIDVDECIHCNICFDTCKFDAIANKGAEFSVDGVKCNGCGICAHACPLKGIDMVPKIVGEWYLSNTALGKCFHGDLTEKQPINIRHLLTIIRKQGNLIAESEEFPFVLTNSPSMEKCRVRNIISGAAYIVLYADGNFDNENIHSLLKLSDTMNIPCFLISIELQKSDFSILFDQYPHLSFAGTISNLPESINGNLEGMIQQYSQNLVTSFKTILQSIKSNEIMNMKYR